MNITKPDDDILSAEFGLSPDEISAQFWEACALATELRDSELPALRDAAGDLRKLLERNSRSTAFL